MKYLNPDYSNYNIEALLEEGRKYFDSFEDVRSLGNAESIQMWHENYQLDQDLLERIKLPPKKEGDTRHTLVLDLDETLIRHVDDIPKFDAEIFVFFFSPLHLINLIARWWNPTVRPILQKNILSAFVIVPISSNFLRRSVNCMKWLFLQPLRRSRTF